MSRSLNSQQPPPDDLDGFPTSQLGTGDIVYRSTGGGHGPGYFSSSGGRFDLQHPRGTLYVGRSIHCAAMERVGPSPSTGEPDETGKHRKLPSLLDGGAVDEMAARSIGIHTLRAAEPMALADLTAREAGISFGVTGELTAGAGVDAYEVSTEWAAALYGAEHDGIEYHSRFVTSTERQDNAIAVFGQAGPGLGRFEHVHASTLYDDAHLAGIRVRPAPSVVPAPDTVSM